MKIDLRELINAIESCGDEDAFYYNKVSGEIVYLSDYSLSGVDYSELSDEIEDTDNYIALPSKYDRHDYQIMKSFIFTIEDEKTSKILLQAISRRGAFRNFKDLIYYFEIVDEWYKFQQETYKKIALDWCHCNNITWV